MASSKEPAKKEPVTASPSGNSGKSLMMKVLANKTVMVALAVLVVVILLVIWPFHQLDTVNKIASGIFSRSLDKLDTCKGVADMAAKNDCYRELAFSTNNTRFCDRVFNASKMAESCYAKLAVEANSKKACNQLEDVKARGFCLHELAINKAETPLCGNIDDKSWRNDCYRQLALVTKKPDPCSKIEEDDTAVADCYLGLAKNITSGPACAYIQDSSKRDVCFLEVGSVNGDKLLCAEIEEPSARWTCYHRVAVMTGEMGLCNKIPVNLNQNCFNAVKKAFPQLANSS